MSEVDDASHDGHGSQIDLEGYRSCRNQECVNLVLTPITHRTGGLCVDCYRSHLGAQVAELEVINRGERITLTLNHNRRKRTDSRGNLHTKRLTERARLKALKRLRAVFPDLYDVFYAEERARLGLEAWTLESSLPAPAEIDAQQTLDFARVYSQLTEHGVDVDGTQVKSQNKNARPR